MYSEAKNPIAQKRNLITAIPGPKSEQLIKRRAEAVSASLGTAFPVFIERAEGSIILDVDGNSILDLGAGIAVLNVGHSSPKVIENVKTQMDAFTHTCFMVVPYTGYVEVCAKNMPYKDGFGPFAPEVYRMPMAYPYRCDACVKPCESSVLSMVIHKIEKEIGASNVACIVIEPILGEGGFVVPCKGFLPGLAKFCKENGIVFIADEVQTGFGRTGNMFACEDESVVPDLIVTAKGIAAGLPLAGVTGRADVMDSIHLSGLGGTYGGNPVACAAALGAIETIEKENLVERANKIGKIMNDALLQMAKKYSVIGEVRGRGAMQAIELIKPGTNEPNSEAQLAIIKYCISKGVLILSAGTYANVIRLLPPLIIDEELLKDGLSVLDEAIASVKS